MSTAARFWSKVGFAEGDACWPWLAGISRGYGRFWLEGRTIAAHRWAYTSLAGPIPVGLVLDHLCRNRSCVRPDHLEPVTQRVNTLRGDTLPAENILKSRCIHGHKLEGDNVRVTPVGRRVCRTCHRANAKRSRIKRGARS